MSAVVKPAEKPGPLRRLPLLACTETNRLVAWRNGRGVTVDEFMADVRRVQALLPRAGSAVNLCEDRYAFLVAFCSAIASGQATLLPSSRAPQAIAEVRARHAGSYVVGDLSTCAIAEDLIRLPELDGARRDGMSSVPSVDPDQIVAIGFTSGSTGQPKPNEKTWGGFTLSSALNIAVLREAMGLADGVVAHIVATVPAQHMYGMEMSILLPLLGAFSVHSGRPFFPIDIAGALADMPEPRLLITTPVHLRALLQDRVSLPPLAAIVTATAPLPAELAREAESRFGTRLIELFGSTETCVIAHRRTASDTDWTLHDGVAVTVQPDGSLVTADHLNQVVVLQDILELLPERRFRLCGRNADLLEIAGKRASLADLSRRVLALNGVRDAVVFQADDSSAASVRRIAALVVAPGRSEKELLAELRLSIDPLFLPRPLKLVASLPRNETGKLPREALLKALQNL
jgi:acyl-coenzyme A synthetase/AMP-(fatty) acid ligase